MSIKKILMIGPDSGKDGGGGIATYINSIMTVLKNSYTIKRVITLSEPQLDKRLYDFITSILQVVYFSLSREDIVAHIHLSSRWSFRRKSVLIRYLHFRKIPIIAHLHSGRFHIFYEQESSQKEQKHINDIFLMCDEVIVLSKSWKDWFSKHIKHPNINVIYNGSKDYLQRDNQISKRDNIILFMGKVCEAKGVYDLLRAFQNTHRKHSDIKLIIAGDGEISKAKELTAELGIEDYVKFLGWVGEEKKTEFLNKSKIFILPSYNEGLPIVILEAMSAKLAIISTRVGGIPETIKDKESGLLINAGDIEKIESAIDSIISDNNYCDFLSQNARASYQSSFQLDTVCNKLKKLYENRR